MAVKADKRGRLSRKAKTGLAGGALLTALLLGVAVIGRSLGLPFIPDAWFEALVRLTPGPLVTFGLETTLSVLQLLGLSIKNTGKTAEQVQAIVGALAFGAVAGAVFFGVVPTRDRRRVTLYGLALGAAVGVVSLVVVLVETPASTTGGAVAGAVWVLATALLWGWLLARMLLAITPARPTAAAAPDAEPALPGSAVPGARRAASEQPALSATAIDRRHFLIRLGGAVAAVTVLGAELGSIIAAESGGEELVVAPPIPFPNAGSPVRPVPGTRLEYTAPSDHYRVDIDLSPPEIDASSWRLKISGLVEHPQQLSLDQLKTAYQQFDQFITLECISNPVGGPLIGTTLWTGPSFRDVLAAAGPRPEARWAHLISQDGYDEVVDLARIQQDRRIVLAHSWNGKPLLAEHGAPLRVYVPDVHGMKQPKWITDVVLVADSIPGYWVKRGWDSAARVHTTSVIDVVVTDRVVTRGGQRFVPVGGIAYAGARGISRVEVQVDGGAWRAATLRQPLSRLSWVIWRYEWPFAAGDHEFAVRAYDGSGALQVTESNPTYPSGATGIDTESATL